jgi:hypothetical protein
MASPIVSAIYFLPITATISPTAIIQGLIVAKTGKYRYLVCVLHVLSILIHLIYTIGSRCLVYPNTRRGPAHRS